MVNMEWKIKPPPVATVVQARLVSTRPANKTAVKPQKEPQKAPEPKPEKLSQSVTKTLPPKPTLLKPEKPEKPDLKVDVTKAKVTDKAKPVEKISVDNKKLALSAKKPPVVSETAAKVMREQTLKEELAREHAEMELLEERQQAQQEAVAEQRTLSRLIDQYKALIQQHVERNWRSPPGLQPDASCTVLVKQLPNGEVVNVIVSECQGGPQFQESVMRAVYKASPLPRAPDERIFDRELRFIFKPGNVP